MTYAVPRPYWAQRTTSRRSQAHLVVRKDSDRYPLFAWAACGRRLHAPIWSRTTTDTAPTVACLQCEEWSRQV